MCFIPLILASLLPIYSSVYLSLTSTNYDKYVGNIPATFLGKMCWISILAAAHNQDTFDNIYAVICPINEFFAQLYFC